MTRAFGRFLCSLVLILGVESAGAATFTVTKTDDTQDGACDADCSLREAIDAANATDEDDLIEFAIVGEAAVQTISPTSELPALAAGHSIGINGLSQPGGNCFEPAIEIDGELAGAAQGLRLLGDSDVIRGLIVNRFSGDGIEIRGANTGVGCSLIGTDASGSQALGNGNGIHVAGSNAFIGGSLQVVGQPGPNLISGNLEAGILVEGPILGATVLSNHIGIDAAGTGSLGNGGPGIAFVDFTAFDGQNALPSRVQGNVIAHNGDAAVSIDGDTTRWVSVRRNATFDNAGIAIDLVGTDAPIGTNPNDPGDPDEGPNRLQNFPVIESATLSFDSSEFTLLFRVDSSTALKDCSIGTNHFLCPNSQYPLQVDFYLRGAGAEAGEFFITSDSYTAAEFDAGAAAELHVTGPNIPVVAGDLIVATATDIDGDGNTSEFSDPIAVVMPEAASGAAGLGALALLGTLFRRGRRVA